MEEKTQMTDPSFDNDGSTGQATHRPSGPTPPHRPRWVMVSLILVAGLIVLFVVLQLTGVAPGRHGPMRHMPAGAPPGSVTEAPGGQP